MPLPTVNNITTGGIFMKISPEMDLGSRESPLDFGSHPYSVYLCQQLANVTTTDRIFLKISPEMGFGSKKSP